MTILNGYEIPNPMGKKVNRRRVYVPIRQWFLFLRSIRAFCLNVYCSLVFCVWPSEHSQARNRERCRYDRVSVQVGMNRALQRIFRTAQILQPRLFRWLHKSDSCDSSDSGIVQTCFPTLYMWLFCSCRVFSFVVKRVHVADICRIGHDLESDVLRRRHVLGRNRSDNAKIPSCFHIFLDVARQDVRIVDLLNLVLAA